MLLYFWSFAKYQVLCWVLYHSKKKKKRNAKSDLFKCLQYIKKEQFMPIYV